MTPAQLLAQSCRNCYFYMLTRDENTIKPDRMVARFVEQAIHQVYNPHQLTHLVIEACRILQTDFPHLTPRILDRLIWKTQQRQP